MEATQNHTQSIVTQMKNKAEAAQAESIFQKHLAIAYTNAITEIGGTQPTNTATEKCGMTAEAPAKRGRKPKTEETAEEEFSLDAETKTEEPSDDFGLDEETETPGITLEDLAKKFSGFATKSEKNKNAALKILKSFEAKSLRDLSPLKYKDASKMLDKLINA